MGTNLNDTAWGDSWRILQQTTLRRRQSLHYNSVRGCACLKHRDRLTPLGRSSRTTDHYLYAGVLPLKDITSSPVAHAVLVPSLWWFGGLLMLRLVLIFLLAQMFSKKESHLETDLVYLARLTKYEIIMPNSRPPPYQLPASFLAFPPLPVASPGLGNIKHQVEQLRHNCPHDGFIACFQQYQPQRRTSSEARR